MINFEEQPQLNEKRFFFNSVFRFWKLTEVGSGVKCHFLDNVKKVKM